MKYTNPKCEYCGRFVSWTADQATYYGSVIDIEPPDPHYFCERCAEEARQEQLKKGQPYQAYWLEPEWNREVAKELSFVKQEYRWIKENA